MKHSRLSLSAKIARVTCLLTVAVMGIGLVGCTNTSTPTEGQLPTPQPTPNPEPAPSPRPTAPPKTKAQSDAEREQFRSYYASNTAARQTALSTITLAVSTQTPEALASTVRNLHVAPEEIEGFLLALTPAEEAQLWETATEEDLEDILDAMPSEPREIWQTTWTTCSRWSRLLPSSNPTLPVILPSFSFEREGWYFGFNE